MTTLKKIRANQKGFTLVELIVVVAILGVLAAVAVPNYMNYLYKTRVSTDIDTARALISVARTYCMTSGKDVSAVITDKATVIDEADLTGKSLASNSTTKIDGLAWASYTEDGSLKFQITVVSDATKAGKFAGSYVVKETGDLPTPVKGTATS